MSSPNHDVKNADLYVKQASSSSSVSERQMGVKILCALSTKRENLVRLLNTPGVVDVFLNAAKKGETNEIKGSGLRGLSNLAFAPKTRVRLFDMPGVVDVFLNAARKGETNKIREFAVTGLSNLAFAPENKVPLYRTYGVLEVFLNAAEKGETRAIIQSGVEGLLNLLVAPQSREELKRIEAVRSALATRSKSENQDTSLFATMALAICIGSDESLKKSEDSLEQLGTDPRILEMITKEFERAINSDMDALVEPLLALRYLTTVKGNRRILGNTWLPGLVRAVTIGLETNDHLVVENSLSCLLQYSLNKDSLSAHAWVVAKRVAAGKAELADWTGAVNAANGLIFKLEARDKVERSEVSMDKPIVMISYSWGPPPHENRKLAAFVESYLKERGFNVWRYENERSNILEAMADAVTRASAVVVLVTKGYKESANCKVELKFALNHKKKIIPLLAEPGYDYQRDGWLGIALGLTALL